MPQLGETVAEGKITKWFKSAGDAVKPGDNLFEIETDKVSMEVPATTAGVLAKSACRPARSRRSAPWSRVIADGRGAMARRSGRNSHSTRCTAVPSRRHAAAAPPRAGARTPIASAARPTAAAQPIKLDPFFEVRTPARNYGPARLAGGIVRDAAGAAARRRSRHRSVAPARLRPARPHRRPRRRRRTAAAPAARARTC